MDELGTHTSTPIPTIFMRLPSSSSFILASLVVSSSSVSALATPVVYGPALDQLSASDPNGSNSASTSCAITFLSNTVTGHPGAKDLVDKVTAPPLVTPELVKAIPNILHAILDPLADKDALKAQEEPLDVVRHLGSAAKTTPAEEADGRGEHASAASEDLSMQPFASQQEASARPADGRQDAPVALSHPHAGFPSAPMPRSGLVGRQAGNHYEGPEYPQYTPLPPL
jgi:hypothetical protein